MKFSIGYNHDSKIFDLLASCRTNIEALYFPVPRDYMGSGRDLHEPIVYPGQIPSIIKKCNDLNISSQLLLNATYEGCEGLTERFWARLEDYLKSLRDRGLTSVVVTNPIYISKIKKKITGLRVESSVNCFLRTVEHALYLRDLGADVLTIDRDINRDIPLIQKIKKTTRLKIRIMLNEGCLSNCPYRVTHYNLLSAGLKLKTEPIKDIFFDSFCMKIYHRDPLKIFRIPFVPPEALGYYEYVADYYKLSTRTFFTEQIKRCLIAYSKRRFTGNLLEILDCPGLRYFDYVDNDKLRKNRFFEKMLQCNLECGRCHYCKRLFSEAVLTNDGFPRERSKFEENKAIRIYGKNLRRVPDKNGKIHSCLEMGKAYWGLGKYGKAIKYMEQVLKYNYCERGVYLILGLCYEKLGDYKKAKHFLFKEKKLYPKNPVTRMGLIRCYKQLGWKKSLEGEIDTIGQDLKNGMLEPFMERGKTVKTF